MTNSTTSLRKLRNAGGFTLRQVADSSGVSLTQLSAAERGDKGFSKEKQEAVAKFYNVDVKSITEFSPGFQKYSTVEESAETYRSNGFLSIKTETLEKLIDVAREEKDWAALQALAVEINRRTER